MKNTIKQELMNEIMDFLGRPSIEDVEENPSLYATMETIKAKLDQGRELVENEIKLLYDWIWENPYLNHNVSLIRSFETEFGLVAEVSREQYYHVKKRRQELACDYKSFEDGYAHNGKYYLYKDVYFAYFDYASEIVI